MLYKLFSENGEKNETQTSVFNEWHVRLSCKQEKGKNKETYRKKFIT